jgi:signal transduction histidine kinase
VGVHSDITEDRDKEEELRSAKLAAESANRAKSAFLASMSHELRTPLNAIIGYSELLEEEAREKGAASIVPDLKRVQSASQHLLAMIDSVLDLSKVEAGRMELFVQNFDIEKTVREAADTTRPLFDRRMNELNVKVEPGLGEMRSDAGKLRQCLLNLLSNAAKFTENGRVTLEVQRANADQIRFRVSDTGMGIPQEQLNRLFEPFMQGDASTAQRFGGTGLGLALTKRFAKLMKGEVRVDSLPGEGSVFTLQLPRLVPLENEEYGHGTVADITPA